MTDEDDYRPPDENAVCDWIGCHLPAECSLQDRFGIVLGWFCREHGRLALTSGLFRPPDDG